MCIAILKEYGVEMPSNQILKRCWRLNDDGAGYAYLRNDDKWQVKKGFKKWNAFKEAFEAEEFKADHTVVIHFRVGTSGKKGWEGKSWDCHPDCTHPFPISMVDDELNAHEYVAENIAMHNGVHSRPTGDLSDSQLAVRDIIAPLAPYWNEDKNIRDMGTRLLHGIYNNSNRWFMAIGSSYYLIGDWQKSEDDVWYSNDGYKPVVTKYNKQGMEALRNYIERSKQHKKEGKLHYLDGQLAYMFHSGGEWDWNKFGDYLAAQAPKPEEGKVVVFDKDGKVNDDITELYDATGNIIGLVDEDGNIIWDDVTMEKDADDRIECPKCSALQTQADIDKENGYCMYCGEPCDGVDYLDDNYVECNECAATLHKDDIKDGICPWCYSLIDLSDWVGDNKIICPNCEEKNHLMDSSFDVGDTECLRCGAVFLSTVVGKGGILTWNQDTKQQHDDFLRIVLDKGGEEAAA
jgi:predicted nucleic acid-binding Zn ribbon protein